MALPVRLPRLGPPWKHLMVVLLWAGWVRVSLVPEWTGSRAVERRVDAQWRDRLLHENRYIAGWLTRYVREHGELPDRLPPNRGAAGNRRVLERCPETREDLITAAADWAFCPETGQVYPFFVKQTYVRSVDPPPEPALWPEP